MSRGTVWMPNKRWMSVEEPQFERITNWEIAVTLANLARFGGRTIRRYSVAQHTCLVWSLAKAENAPQAVLDACAVHDCGEVITGDIPTPVKDTFPAVREWCEHVQRLVNAEFSVHEAVAALVKPFDQRAFEIETQQLYDLQGQHLFAWTPKRARESLLAILPRRLARSARRAGDAES